VSGKALDWFESYLSNRSQSVVIDGVSSETKTLKCGVPQGSVLGPILFTCYMSPLSDILREFDVKFHLYADDSQIYVSFDPNLLANQVEAFHKIESCANNVRLWMAKNMLKMNDSKTVFMILGNKPQVEKLVMDSVVIGDSVIEASATTVNLGVTFDSGMIMKAHVKKSCQAGYMQLRNIARIRDCLNREALESIIHSLITSRLDYCNSLLCGIPKATLRPLQMLQNSAARLITKTRKYDSITPVLISLHWLPVQARCEYKVLLYAYKARNKKAPYYLIKLLSSKEELDIRSHSTLQLFVPKTKCKSFGDRSFAAKAPVLWNSLDDEVLESGSMDAFKSRIKTILFKRYFPVNS